MKEKNTKKALLGSILTMIVCVGLLVGSTFAWFTDSVTSKGNIIKSGNLDVEMYYADGTETLNNAKWKDASTEPIFNNEKWEPGYTEAKHIKIENKGNLAFKYEVRIAVDGAVSELADVIDVYYVQGGKQIENRTGLTDAKKIGTLSSLLKEDNIAKGHVSKGEADIATIALKMQETAGNEYQGMKIGDNFTIQLVATQYAEEEDSFGKDYDKDVAYPQYVSTEKELKDAITNVEDDSTIVLKNDIDLTTPLTLSNKNVQIDLNNYQMKSKAIGNMIQATGTADVSIANGALVVNNDDASTIFVQNSAKVYVNNCNISYSGRWGYAVNTNGSLSKDANITIVNSRIASPKGYTCYFPAGTILLKDCDVLGAVIISGGDVTIDGGIYTADGFSNQAKIWHKEDTISYMEKFSDVDGCGHMGDSVLIMDRRAKGYGVANVTIQNATFHTELTLQDGTKETAYAIKYVDYNNVASAERGRLNITGNTYLHQLTSGSDPLMFIGIDGTDISYK